MTATVLPRVLPAEHRVSRTPYLVLAVLQVLDVLTTGWILARIGNVHEGNPVVRTLLDGAGLYAGLAALLLAKVLVVGVLYVCQTRVRLAQAVYGAVIVNNLLALGMLL